jgi:hypothetical protein
MNPKCVLCEEEIDENYGKLKGTVIRSKDEKGEILLIHVCKYCQRKEGWEEEALIRGA